jgi:hypothetical protein
MAANGARPVVLTAVQARRVLAYLTVLERAVVEDEVSADQLPMWEQLEEVILGLDGLGLTIDAVTEALGDDDEGGGGDDDGVREPRRPPPDGGLAHDELEPGDDLPDRPPTPPPTVGESRAEAGVGQPGDPTRAP